MRDFLLDDNGDVVVDSDIQTVSGNDETSQRIITTLRTRLDEFEPEDSAMGLTLENAVGKAYNEDYLSSDITELINQQVDESIEVKELSFDRDLAQRTLTVHLTYSMPNGTDQTVVTDIGGEY